MTVIIIVSIVIGLAFMAFLALVYSALTLGMGQDIAPFRVDRAGRLEVSRFVPALPDRCRSLHFRGPSANALDGLCGRSRWPLRLDRSVQEGL